MTSTQSPTQPPAENTNRIKILLSCLVLLALFVCNANFGAKLSFKVEFAANLFVSIFGNTGANSTIVSCVMLANPVAFHSEVQIAFHSYLIEACLPACVYDTLAPELGYDNWFTPPKSTNVVLSRDGFWNLRLKNLTRPLVVITVSQEDANKNAIVIIHHIDQIPSKAAQENWTLVFLGPFVETFWQKSATQPPDATPAHLSFVPVWRATTALSVNPFIHTASVDHDMPLVLDWEAIAAALNTSRTDWEAWRYKLLHFELHAQVRLQDLKSWRYFVVQGNMEHSRRDYKTLFEWLAHSNAALHPQFKLIVLGKLVSHPLDLGFDIVVNQNLQNKVVVIPNCKHIGCAAVIEHARFLFPCHTVNNPTYLQRTTASIPTAISHGIPIVGDERAHLAYGLPVQNTLIEYTNPNILNVGWGTNEYSNTNGSLAKFGTFEEAVRWAISLDDLAFSDLRHKVLAVRDEIFEKNTKQFSELIHRTQLQ
eukprot:c3963_g1_i1.p1 GENE.c3963_g1_i1~~c3963_g1_i1.p1  ORF type:complete len:494 (+),score=98.58 c3963_g1_i1:42-1484(+)